MSTPAAHLHLVASNEPESARESVAREFRSTMIEHLRAHTDGTNVNPDTLLTTDYLNHFHEIVMLLELAPSAPDQFIPELTEWRRKSYEEHFTHSGFRDKKLAVAAYRNAPEETRAAFDSAIDALEREIAKLLKQARDKFGARDLEGLNALCAEAAPRLRALTEAAAAIANGDEQPARPGKNKPDKTQSVQDEIDALFG